MRPVKMFDLWQISDRIAPGTRDGVPTNQKNVDFLEC
jgi:hypothetical protein